jgi:import inner membrane translocase subunit TIM22
LLNSFRCRLFLAQHIDGTLTAAKEAEKKSARQVAREMIKSTGARSFSYAKGFGAMGALFAGSECVIEKARARHDMMNSVYAGCFTGGALARGGGPQAMGVGCATFAAFSAVIDKFMEH